MERILLEIADTKGIPGKTVPVINSTARIFRAFPIFYFLHMLLCPIFLLYFCETN